MQQAVSELKLQHYQVLDLQFSLNADFVFKKGNIEINPSFHREIVSIDDNQFKVILSVCIDAKQHSHPIPFTVHVKLAATFTLANWSASMNSSITTDNTTAILFPYLRTLVSSITNMGNVPPYNIPIMNVTRLFDEKSN